MLEFISVIVVIGMCLYSFDLFYLHCFQLIIKCLLLYLFGGKYAF